MPLATWLQSPSHDKKVWSWLNCHGPNSYSFPPIQCQVYWDWEFLIFFNNFFSRKKLGKKEKKNVTNSPTNSEVEPRAQKADLGILWANPRRHGYLKWGIDSSWHTQDQRIWSHSLRDWDEPDPLEYYHPGKSRTLWCAESRSVKMLRRLLELHSCQFNHRRRNQRWFRLRVCLARDKNVHFRGKIRLHDQSFVALRFNEKIHLLRS